MKKIAVGWVLCYPPQHSTPQGGGPMAFCGACGAEVSGAALVASPTAGLDENVAGLLCYVLGWITGLIFFLIDKRPFVRFHAAQSIGMSIGLFALYLVIGVLFTMLHFMSMGFMALAIYPLLGLLVFVLWIFLMYKAYQHEKFMLPIIGPIAANMAGK
jgi:uncharacterized membrane protein